MYIKVHKKNGQWFRNNTGALVGTEVPNGKFLEGLKLLYGNHIIVQKNNKFFVILYGYYDDNKKFYHFCQSDNCEGCVGKKRTIFCPKSFADNPCKQKSGGYYLKTD